MSAALTLTPDRRSILADLSRRFESIDVLRRQYAKTKNIALSEALWHGRYALLTEVLSDVRLVRDMGCLLHLWAVK